MKVDTQLSLQQTKQIASYFSTKDIQKYTEKYKKEYEQFLKEEEQNGKNKESKEDTKEENINAIWQQYADDTICTIDTNKKSKIDIKNAFNNTNILVKSKAKYSLDLKENIEIEGEKQNG